MSMRRHAKRLIRPILTEARFRLVRAFRSYDGAALIAALRKQGVAPGDTLMVHAAWAFHNGFTGGPSDMVKALREAVGPEGLLVMTSLTYSGSSAAFLAGGKPMNVRRSPSAMGLLTEVFRRTKGVRRSLSATHPLLAWGERAAWFVAGHEQALAPFGPKSPFAKLLNLNGKILAIDTPYESVTFTHFLEDRIQSTLDFPLYDPGPMIGTVIDEEGRHLDVPVLVLSEASRRLRREERLIASLERGGLLNRFRVGNTKFILIECRPLTEFVEAMVARGDSFFESSAHLVSDPDG